MEKKKAKIEESWYKVLENEFDKPYFTMVKQFLVKEMKAGKAIYPPGSLMFNAFNSTPFDKVKVVLLGQDPYHQHGQAMGLSFSVPRGVRVPASLRNVYIELESDVDFKRPTHGDLSYWAKQGVFLLNAMLSVERGKAGAHKKIGWQQFTDAVIRNLSDQRESLVFMLWGNFAKGKKDLIDENKHLILEAAHPSPLARNAFMGSKHFSKANAYLVKNGKTPIDWQLPG